jgi:hypothetical protein
MIEVIMGEENPPIYKKRLEYPSSAGRMNGLPSPLGGEG